MERGAAKAASRNARVIDMEDLKKARQQRASSAHHPYEGDGGADPAFRDQYEEWREEQDDRPFWERDDPFGSDGYTPRQQPAQEQRMHRSQREQEIEYDPEPEERPARKASNPRIESEGRRVRQSFERQPRRIDDRRQPRPDDRHQAPSDDRWQTAPHARQQGRAAQSSNSHTGLYMLMLLLALLALAVLIGLKIFEITNIEVKGNETMTSESVIALAGISRGENIFKVNLGQARKNLESDPLVEVVGISRLFPDRIRIEIRQRKPHGAIAYLGSYIIIDEKGFVLDERPDLPAGQYPLITGIDIQPSEKGKKLAGVDNAKLQTMYKLLTALYDNKAMQYVSEANLSHDDDITLLTAEGLQIDVGKPTDLPKKAQWIACTVPELRTKGYTSGVLYVTGTNGPVFSASDAGSEGQDGTKGNVTDNGAGTNGNGYAASGDAGNTQKDDSSGNAA